MTDAPEESVLNRAEVRSTVNPLWRRNKSQ
jgi:hypothetical protein